MTCSAALLVFGLAMLAPAHSLGAAHAQSDRIANAASQATPTLHLGSRGPVVRELQGRLARLSYLPSAGVDGAFGMQTWHAVVAFQGWSSLARDGVAGPRTYAALAHARRPRPWSTATGVEVHIAQQVLLLVRHGRVQRAIHVSTGVGASTPVGHYRIYRREAMSWSVPFRVCMPLAQYFHRGYAMHAFASVPSYPASHGCVRLPQSAASAAWQFGRIGMRVWTRA